MKVKMYIDLPEGSYVDPKTLLALGDQTVPLMLGWTRYELEVDLPIKHFREANTVKVKAELTGEMEK